MIFQPIVESAILSPYSQLFLAMLELEPLHDLGGSALPVLATSEFNSVPSPRRILPRGDIFIGAETHCDAAELSTLPSPLIFGSLGGPSPLHRAFPWLDFSRPSLAEKRIYRCACRAFCPLLLFPHIRDSKVSISHTAASLHQSFLWLHHIQA